MTNAIFFVIIGRQGFNEALLIVFFSSILNRGFIKEKKKFGINLVAFLLLLVSLLSANMAFALPPFWEDGGCVGGGHLYRYDDGNGGTGWIIFHNAPECS